MSSDWKTLESRLIFKNPWIKLHEDKVRTPSGKTMLYSWYESADVVVVVPFLDDSTPIITDLLCKPIITTKKELGSKGVKDIGHYSLKQALVI